jgi:hypothetical protein
MSPELVVAYNKGTQVYLRGGGGAIAQYCDKATGWTTGVRFPAGLDSSFRHNIQTGSGAHPVGTGGHFSQMQSGPSLQLKT